VIVVDVNVIVYLLTDTPQRELARRVRACDGDWLVPPLWRHEMLNVLATLTRQDVLDGSAALTVWRNAVGLLGTREQQPNMEQALSLAIEKRISAYDAQYVALAAALGVQLISEDKKLQRQLSEWVISMAGFTDRMHGSSGKGCQ
jgi:predicted nucleic acid-binding protein